MERGGRTRPSRAAAGAWLLLALAGGVGADEAYRAAIGSWREQREAKLRSDGGWLSVAGLTWLKPGANSFGSGPGVDVALPARAPARAGVFVLSGGGVHVELAAGVAAAIDGHAVVGPTPMRLDSSLVLGDVALQVIERGGRLAIRLRDKNAPARQSFTGCRWYEIKEEYRVEGRWVAHPAPRPIKVPNVLGQTEWVKSPGYAEFSLGGRKLQLDGVLETPDASEIWFILHDETSGKETYPGGRFLYSEMPKGGRIVLDFNKAYNPPCAFTAFATCPLPPRQNWMPVRVEAGELTYGKH